MTEVENNTRRMNKSLDAFIGGKIKFRRTTIGMSQEKLGSHLGITFQQIQKYEKGSNRVSASMLYNIAKILHVNIDYFLNDYEKNASLADDNQATYHISQQREKESKEYSELIKAYNKISNQKLKKKAIDMMKTLAGI